MTAAHVRSAAALDALPPDEAERALLTCCAAPSWARTLAAGRPYGDARRLTEAADAALAALPWSEVELALAAHPRIGAQPTGAGREAGWSRREQSGIDVAGAEIQAALAAGNTAYEQRFGHVYLVRAAGRSAAEMLALLTARLGNDAASERAVVRAQLGEIVQLRLARLLSEGPA